MLSNQITSLLSRIQNGEQSAPLLLSESHACEVWSLLSDREIHELDELREQSRQDFLYYDCGDRVEENHKVKNIREHTEKLYQKPAGTILCAIFRNIETLTDESANALLRLFEDVPPQVLIIVTSKSPTKIIPTLLSRILLIDGENGYRGANPFQEIINDFFDGHPEKIFQITLAPSKESRFSREDALWIVQGLQDGLECGKIHPRYAKNILSTRIQLETTNTIAKYLIDQLIITLSCD